MEEHQPGLEIDYMFLPHHAEGRIRLNLGHAGYYKGKVVSVLN
jgi:hypothetical protein